MHDQAPAVNAPVRLVAAPVAEGSRVSGLDAARGFALLGILLVNIQMFGETLGSYISGLPQAKDTGADLVAYYAVKALCDGKFYPLFSLLFGAGMALQRERLRARGGAFTPLYVRRLLLLGLMGLCHAIFLWYGDILFIYAGAGFLLLAMSGLRARTQAIVAAILIAVSTMLMGGFGALGALMQKERVSQIAASSEAGAAEAAPAQTALEIMRDAGPEAFDPNSEARARAETIAFRDGPYWHAVMMRGVNWGAFMMVVVIGFGWHVLALMLLGSALVKWGVLLPGRERTLRSFARWGMLVGLPLAAGLALAPAYLGGAGIVLQALNMMIGPLVALGYLSAIVLLARRASANPVIRALANAGRMALTVYLLESVCAQFVFQHWGLARFGEFTRLERIGLVFGLYLALLAFASLWMRVFQMGPMEWLWRTGTYLRAQSLLRRRPE